MHDQQQHDVLIIGSGAAGLSLALKLGQMMPMSQFYQKKSLNEGATLYAQGGVSAVLDEQDSIESHVDDTLRAGAGLCDPDIVRFVVERAYKSIDWLVELGVSTLPARILTRAVIRHFICTKKVGIVIDALFMPRMQRAKPLKQHLKLACAAASRISTYTSTTLP